MGQEKPCYIYRLIALGSIEEQVYRRQVTKLSTSKRVVDEQQIDRHYNQQDLNEYYNTNHIIQDKSPEVIIPQDQILAKQLEKHSHLIHSYHIHDSLLQNNTKENLSQYEINYAWDQYECEKKNEYQKHKIAKYRQVFEKGKFIHYSILENCKIQSF